jgi:hypothetical protein
VVNLADNGVYLELYCRTFKNGANYRMENERGILNPDSAPEFEDLTTMPRASKPSSLEIMSEL